MKKKEFIFITTEGHTFQPNSTSIEPDIENAQVIGYASGFNPDEAFNNLLEQNEYLRATNFNELICYELNRNYSITMKYFYLK